MRKKIRKPELKVQAYKEYYKALKNGLIIRPNQCSNCGETSKRIHGHHPDYSKPLLVMWLCASCHMSLHAKIRWGNKVVTGAIVSVMVLNIWPVPPHRCLFLSLYQKERLKAMRYAEKQLIELCAEQLRRLGFEPYSPTLPKPEGTWEERWNQYFETMLKG